MQQIQPSAVICERQVIVVMLHWTCSGTHQATLSHKLRALGGRKKTSWPTQHGAWRCHDPHNTGHEDVMTHTTRGMTMSWPTQHGAWRCHDPHYTGHDDVMTHTKRGMKMPWPTQHGAWRCHDPHNTGHEDVMTHTTRDMKMSWPTQHRAWNRTWPTHEMGYEDVMTHHEMGHDYSHSRTFKNDCVFRFVYIFWHPNNLHQLLFCVPHIFLILYLILPPNTTYLMTILCCTNH